MINPNSYIVKTYWMISGLGLRGVELEVYSIIYGFTQNDKEHAFTISYFEEWTNYSEKTVKRAISSLRRKNIIEIRYIKGKASFYKYNAEKADKAISFSNDKYQKFKTENGIPKASNEQDKITPDLSSLGEELRKFDPYGFQETKKEEKRI